MDDEDKISKLPENILHHHILSLLRQDDAVRTCILSKSWRHLGPTRPKIEFHEIDFKESKGRFLSVVENTIQRYVDQKLPIQEFILEMWEDNKPCSVLVKKIINLLVLNRLELHFVYIDDETLKKIMSRCPLIEHLVLSFCTGLTSVQVNKARYLKHLHCDFTMGNGGGIEINDDAPSLETCILIGGANESWFHLHKNYFFPRLKSLLLNRVFLRTELLNNLLSSNNCPCLEELELCCCSGLTEFKLSSRSIKRLIVITDNRRIKAAAIDAPNMLYFEFGIGRYSLPSISFSTTSRECKSRVHVWRLYSLADDVLSSTWYPVLHDILTALSQSQISLDISYFPKLTTNIQESAYDGGGISEPPLVVEHLCLRGYFLYYALPKLLNCLFRICRPRYINLPLYSHLNESLWKTIVNKGETTQCHFWQKDLEESSIQVLDKNANEWRDVQLQVCALSNNEEIRFRLKRRDY